MVSAAITRFETSPSCGRHWFLEPDASALKFCSLEQALLLTRCVGREVALFWFLLPGIQRAIDLAYRFHFAELNLGEKVRMRGQEG